MPEPIIDIHAAWKAVEFIAHPPALARHPAISELGRVYGDAAAASFSVADPAHWRAYQQSMWRPQWDFTARLLDSPAFAAAVPALAPPRRAPHFDRLFAFDLAGSFARALHSGGAHHRVEPVARAEELARSLVQTLIDDRRETVDVLFADEAWHAWFADVAWDRTWIVLDWEAERIHFLAVTSSD